MYTIIQDIAHDIFKHLIGVNGPKKGGEFHDRFI